MRLSRPEGMSKPRGTVMGLSQEDDNLCRLRSPVLFLAIVLYVLGISIGFSWPILFVALVMSIIALLLSGRHVVIVLPNDKAFPVPSIDQTDKSPVPTPAPAPATPFENRLARFLQCNEADLGEPQSKWRSKMIFWSAVPFGPRHEPKPAWFIRLVLERIRKLVHG